MTTAHPPSLRPPYGISNFRVLRDEGYAYVDKSRFLRVIEQRAARYLILLRPRRFGKSLWLSLMRYHYDLLATEHWERLFAGLDAAVQPSPERSSYRVLEVDFSAVASDSVADAAEGMRAEVIRGVTGFCEDYDIGSVRERQAMAGLPTAADVLGEALRLAGRAAFPVYVLIDEYDHFTNELLTRDSGTFSAAVERGGFVRKFYEALKKGTKTCVRRIFMTGVTPVTLDSLTSGFNIAADLTREPRYHELMGFSQTEVERLLSAVLGLGAAEQADLMAELKRWYNGYCFVPGEPRLFNPDMVLYYLDQWGSEGCPPRRMLDTNVASDYRTVERTLDLGQRSRNVELLEQVLEEGQADVALTEQDTLYRGFGRHDFGSLLFYLGLLTCRGERGDRVLLGIPNQVIAELHWRTFLEILLERGQLEQGTVDHIADAVNTLAFAADPQPLMNQVSLLLDRTLSNRDLRHFGEKHLKVILLAFLSTTQIYLVQSEVEVARGYVDLLLSRRPTIDVPWEHAFELKYLSSTAADAAVAETARLAEEQTLRYLRSPALAARPDLACWVVVFRGAECAVLRRNKAPQST